MRWLVLITLLVSAASASAQTLAERTTQILVESADYVDTVTTRVLCPECQSTGNKSKVYIEGSYYREQTWTGGFYDEDGFFVPVDFHGDSVTQYRCNRGHVFEKGR